MGSLRSRPMLVLPHFWVEFFTYTTVFKNVCAWTLFMWSCHECPCSGTFFHTITATCGLSSSTCPLWQLPTGGRAIVDRSQKRKPIQTPCRLFLGCDLNQGLHCCKTSLLTTKPLCCQLGYGLDNIMEVKVYSVLLILEVPETLIKWFFSTCRWEDMRFLLHATYLRA